MFSYLVALKQVFLFLSLSVCDGIFFLPWCLSVLLSENIWLHECLLAIMWTIVLCKKKCNSARDEMHTSMSFNFMDFEYEYIKKKTILCWFVGQRVPFSLLHSVFVMWHNLFSGRHLRSWRDTRLQFWLQMPLDSLHCNAQLYWNAKN